jgi:hypothetical protein
MQINLAGVKVPILNKNLVPCIRRIISSPAIGSVEGSLNRSFLVCLLPHHFHRNLILPDSKKDRLSEAVIPRPFRESYLANHHRFHPVTPPHLSGGQPLIPTVSTNCRKIEKRALFNADFVQLRMQSAQKFFAKAGGT